MCNMNILLPKLLCQALTKGSQCELAGGKGASDRASSKAGSCTSEDKASSLPGWLLEVVPLECKYRSARE